MLTTNNTNIVQVFPGSSHEFSRKYNPTKCLNHLSINTRTWFLLDCKPKHI